MVDFPGLSFFLSWRLFVRLCLISEILETVGVENKPKKKRWFDFNPAENAEAVGCFDREKDGSMRFGETARSGKEGLFRDVGKGWNLGRLWPEPESVRIFRRQFMI